MNMTKLISLNYSFGDNIFGQYLFSCSAIDAINVLRCVTTLLEYFNCLP